MISKFIFENINRRIRQNSRKRSRVGVFIINNGKFVIGEPTNNFPYKYIIPGGGIENSETIKDTAYRESREEISVIPKNIQLIDHPDNPYKYCGLKRHGFKYDCSELFWVYAEHGGRDRSIWGTDDGFKTPPKEISFDEMIRWLQWAINQTRNDYVRNTKYKYDLIMVNQLRKNGIV